MTSSRSSQTSWIETHWLGVTLLVSGIVFISFFVWNIENYVDGINKINQLDQQEHDKISKMSCLDLHDYLVKDKPYSSWNRDYASNLYLVSCK